ncbi:hypothetical protein Nepgr_003859 [Nepenthes gracilis]|uniref:Uncharacterized protein n=1 Tax=Nepenthes gracilis TaxID=150966 RepID=A0AAD3S0A7_NEPGR|nr:hypothetical protein Nepgr_003859 [Nepenthes gracilis]
MYDPGAEDGCGFLDAALPDEIESSVAIDPLNPKETLQHSTLLGEASSKSSLDTSEEASSVVKAPCKCPCAGEALVFHVSPGGEMLEHVDPLRMDPGYRPSLLCLKLRLPDPSCEVLSTSNLKASKLKDETDCLSTVIELVPHSSPCEATLVAKVPDNYSSTGNKLTSHFPAVELVEHAVQNASSPMLPLSFADIVSRGSINLICKAVMSFPFLYLMMIGMLPLDCILWPWLRLVQLAQPIYLQLPPLKRIIRPPRATEDPKC